MALNLGKLTPELRQRIEEQIANEDSRKIQNPKPQLPLQPKSLGTDEGKEDRPRRTRVRFTSFRRRMLDRTNIEAGIKFLEDALVYAGCVEGDSETEINRTVKQVKVKTKEEERTEIEITEVDGSEWYNANKKNLSQTVPEWEKSKRDPKQITPE
jgi:hypothetical protein